MIGWFSAFRENGSPSDFQVGPAPFPINQQLIGLLSIFIIPSIAFLIVLPGIRHQKLTSAITFLFTMFTGASLLVSIFQPCWQKAEARILVNYKSFNNQRMDAYLQINVGLSKVNITLQTQGPLLNYNEQFELRNRNPIEFERALQRGSLYPFLTILEFLTIDLNGFDYGKKLHFAGYYTAALLWFSFTLWIFQFLFLYILPNKFGVLSLCVGINTLLANLCYFSSTPNQLVIRFPSPQGQTAFLKFHFSYCFYATFICGLASTFVGLALIFARHFFKYTLETSISDYSTYREETQCKLRKKQGSVVGSLRNLDIFVINNKKVNEDSWSLAPTTFRTIKSFDQFCFPTCKLNSSQSTNNLPQSKVFFF